MYPLLPPSRCGHWPQERGSLSRVLVASHATSKFPVSFFLVPSSHTSQPRPSSSGGLPTCARLPAYRYKWCHRTAPIQSSISPRRPRLTLTEPPCSRTGMLYVSSSSLQADRDRAAILKDWYVMYPPPHYRLTLTEPPCSRTSYNISMYPPPHMAGTRSWTSPSSPAPSCWSRWASKTSRSLLLLTRSLVLLKRSLLLLNRSLLTLFDTCLTSSFGITATRATPTSRVSTSAFPTGRA
jgi:hypothetical protein